MAWKWVATEAATRAITRELSGDLPLNQRTHRIYDQCQESERGQDSTNGQLDHYQPPQQQSHARKQVRDHRRMRGQPATTKYIHQAKRQVLPQRYA